MESGFAGATALLEACRGLSETDTTRVLDALAKLPMSTSARSRLQSLAEQGLLDQTRQDQRSTFATSAFEALRTGAPRAPRIITVRAVDAELVTAAASQLSGDGALASSCWSDRSDARWYWALGQVDRETAGGIVANLVRRVLDSNSAAVHGARLVEVVGALPPGFPLEVASIVDGYLRDSRGLLTKPFAVVIGRADLDDLLHGFADVLRAAASPIKAIDLFEVVAQSVEPSPIVRRIGDHFDDETLADPYDDESLWEEEELIADDGDDPGSLWEEEELVADDGDDAGSLTDNGGELDRRVSYDRGYGIEDQHAVPQRRWIDDTERRRPAEDAGGRDDGGRHLRVDVFVATESGARRAVSRAFVRGERHALEVWIGLDRDARPTTVTNPDPFDDSAVDRESGDHTILEVIVNHRGQPIQTSALLLPNDSRVSTLPCQFELLVGPNEADVYATVLVKQGNRLLSQSQLIGSGVMTPDDPLQGSPIELIPEVVARSLEYDFPSTQFDVCIAKPTRDDPVVTRPDGTVVALAPWRDGIRATVEVVADKIYDTAAALVSAGGEDPWNALIRTLAWQGSNLHGWLEDNGYDALTTAGRIQLLDADPTEPLPIELVYDRGGVADDAVPCPDWAGTLARGACDACAKYADGLRSPYVCPLGFWGLTKIIERQTGTATGDPATLHPFTSALFAASGEVRPADAQETYAVLQGLGLAATEVLSWETWAGVVREHRPALMVMLPHQGFNTDRNQDFLEIGPKSRLYPRELKPNFVKVDGGPSPVVLLLGCRTANGSVSYQNFVSEFISKGAPIVIGTLATVLGRDAALIAQDFVRDLAASTRGAGAAPLGFGETIRAVRRRMVLKRNPAALGLIAFGDSDWHMVGAS